MLVGLGSRDWENCQCAVCTTFACYVVHRSGVNMVQVWGSGLRGGRATRANDRRLDVGVVGANAGGLFLSPKCSPWPRKEKVSRSGLGWARGERPAPSRCETGLATVGLSFAHILFFIFFLLADFHLQLVLCLLLSDDIRPARFFLFPLSRTGPLQTAANPRHGVNLLGARTHFTAAA